MPTLDALLKRAADEPDWARVMHRCAWCGRILDERGRWVRRPVDATRVATHGMCPPCGRRALAQVTARRSRPTELAA